MSAASSAVLYPGEVDAIGDQTLTARLDGRLRLRHPVGPMLGAVGGQLVLLLAVEPGLRPSPVPR